MGLDAPPKEQEGIVERTAACLVLIGLYDGTWRLVPSRHKNKCGAMMASYLLMLQ
jgi:hypothetical protein